MRFSYCVILLLVKMVSLNGMLGAAVREAATLVLCVSRKRKMELGDMRRFHHLQSILRPLIFISLKNLWIIFCLHPVLRVQDKGVILAEVLCATSCMESCD